VISQPKLAAENVAQQVMDAMSEAVEHSEVILFGVSLLYKESSNCRLEANYGMQEEKDMIPLMMQEDYKPKGWRKSQPEVLGLF
jgi:hypothetical protein